MASTSVNPDLEDQVPGGAGVVVRVLQGLEQPVEGPGPVVGEDDDPELGLRVTEDCDVTSPEGPHPGHQGRKVGRVAGFTEYRTENKSRLKYLTLTHLISLFSDCLYFA